MIICDIITSSASYSGLVLEIVKPAYQSACQNMASFYFYKEYSLNTFSQYGLKPEILNAIQKIGYEIPTDIQNRAIPALMDGHDILGRAQTGTGKTAAFALPILEKVDPQLKHVQALVMTPTRELALQVAHAFSQFGQYLNIRVLPVYGGQSYMPQLKALKEGVQIVVGTPGRILDLVNKKKSLDLGQVNMLVLDEADEMLAMGFIEEVEEIIRLTSDQRQTSLFSATLSKSILNLAGKHLHNPQEISIQGEHVTVEQTEQRHYLVTEKDKIQSLVRLLETEKLESVLLFTRTKVRASELADSLQALGYPVDSLHGDLKQEEREKVMGHFRKGKITILVATDVAARGLDVKGVSHVINFDVPLDPEGYVHRIGRTGRAGKSGVAITLATPGDRRRLRVIEQYTKQPIPQAKLPSVKDIQKRRDEAFVDKIVACLAMEEHNPQQEMVKQIVEFGYSPLDVAAAAIQLMRQGEKQQAMEEIQVPFEKPASAREYSASKQRNGKRKDSRQPFEAGMVRLSINLGHSEGIHPGNIVGAIANTSGIPGSAIGAIDIQRKMTFLDVSEQYVGDVLFRMRNWRINNKPVQIQSV